jgi:hypothetical protein
MSSLIRNLQFQYASNLLLEYRSTFSFNQLVKPNSPILCLTGDIGSPYSKITKRFIDWASDNWEHVLWVPGYTELAPKNGIYNVSIHDALNKLEDICHHKSNIKIMNNKSFKVKDTPYIFLGSPLFGHDHTHNIHFHCNGPNQTIQRLHPFQLNLIAQSNSRWLDGHIVEAKEYNERVICLTYSPPVREVCKHRDLVRTNWMVGTFPNLIRHPVYAWIVGDMYESVHLKCNSNIDTAHTCSFISNSLKDIINNNYKNSANIHIH